MGFRFYLGLDVQGLGCLVYLGFIGFIGFRVSCPVQGSGLGVQV